MSACGVFEWVAVAGGIAGTLALLALTVHMVIAMWRD